MARQSNLKLWWSQDMMIFFYYRRNKVKNKILSWNKFEKNICLH